MAPGRHAEREGGPAGAVLPPRLRGGRGTLRPAPARQAGLACDVRQLEFGNRCEVLKKHFPCENGCGHQVQS